MWPRVLKSSRSAPLDTLFVGSYTLAQNTRLRERTAMQVCSKIWIEQDGQVLLSDWRVALLEAIAATGSLAAAARQLNVPYRTAWHKLKRMEAGWGVPLVIATPGGEGGGSCRLTAHAHTLIQQFHTIAHGTQDQVATRFAAAFQQQLPGPALPAVPEVLPSPS